MAGKAPLLLATVLFFVGAAGLGLTSAERAEWGPFEPHNEASAPQRVLVVATGPVFTVPPLHDLLTGVPEVTVQSSLLVAAPEPEPVYEPEPEATATPNPPLRVFGIASDDGGVSAAEATPPPLRVINVASDDGGEPAEETPSPEAEETPAPEPTEPPAE